MTRSANAKAWDGLVRSTLGERGWKIVAGGYGTRRSEVNLLSSSLRHDRKQNVVYGHVGSRPLAFDAVARELERVTELPRNCATSVPTWVVSKEPFTVVVGDDLDAAVAAAAARVHRESVELDEQLSTLEAWDCHLAEADGRRDSRLLLALAQGDHQDALRQAWAWFESPEHYPNDFQRPSARSLAMHVIEWLAPVPISHAISSPGALGASPLQAPWADTATILEGVLPQVSRQTEAYIVWAVPSGEPFIPTMDVPPIGYVQAAGEADRWTVEVNRAAEGRPRNFVLGRAGGDTEPQVLDVLVPWQQTTLRVRPHECFTRDEVVSIFARWVGQGDVDPALTLRMLDVP